MPVNLSISSSVSTRSVLQSLVENVSNFVVNDIGGYLFESSGISLVPQESSPSGIIINPEGTVMLMCGYGNKGVYRYDMSTPYDISPGSMSYSGQTINLTGVIQSPFDLVTDSTGTKLYLSSYNFGILFEYTLVAPYVLTGATLTAQIDLNTIAGIIGGVDYITSLFLDPTNTHLYVGDHGTDKIHQFTFGTPGILASLSYTGSLDVSAQMSNVRDIFIDPTGLTMWVLESSTEETVFQYTLTTPNVVASATYANKSLVITANDNAQLSLIFSPNGASFFTVGLQHKKAYKYSIT